MLSIGLPQARSSSVAKITKSAATTGPHTGSVVGVDLVEVAPDYDPTGSTTTLAAQILLNLIGRIAANR